MLGTARDAALSAARVDLARQINGDLKILSRRYGWSGWQASRTFSEGVAARAVQDVVHVELRYARHKKLIHQGKHLYALVCLDRGKFMRLAQKMEAQVRQSAQDDAKLSTRNVDEPAVRRAYGAFVGDVAQQRSRVALLSSDEPRWKLFRNERKQLAGKGLAVLHAAQTRTGQLASRCTGVHCPGLVSIAYTAVGFDLHGMGPVALHAFSDRTRLLQNKRPPKPGDVAFLTPVGAPIPEASLVVGIVESVNDAGVVAVLMDGEEGTQRVQVRHGSDSDSVVTDTEPEAWMWLGSASIWRHRLLLKESSSSDDAPAGIR
jgi:hypothetical protein